MVQRAARSILPNLVNHLTHLPQVSEHDNVPSLVSKELNMEFF